MAKHKEQGDEETALATIESQYPVLAGDVQATMEVIRENLGGEQIGPNDLTRVKVPGSGATTWEVPTASGEQSQKELEGVIVFHKQARTYWAEGLEEGGGKPPDCWSDDAVTGHGEPGGDCATCQFAQFGSDDKERGQACKLMRQLFILRPGQFLPTLVTVPPSSLKGARAYLLGLASEGIPYYGVKTKLTLEKQKNQDGIAFAQINFLAGEKLDGDDKARVKGYVDAIKGSLNRVRAT